MGSCAHKPSLCYILLVASAAPSFVFSELCQVLIKQWPHSRGRLLALVISARKGFFFPLFSCKKILDSTLQNIVGCFMFKVLWPLLFGYDIKKIKGSSRIQNITKTEPSLSLPIVIISWRLF